MAKQHFTDNKIYLWLFAFSQSCFCKIATNIVFLSVDLMAWQNCKLQEWVTSTRMIAFNQFLFIDQIAGLERWTLPPTGRSARVWPVGGWNFDLANSDALVSTNSRASDGFAIRPTSGWNVHPRKIVLYCMRMRECAIRCPIPFSNELQHPDQFFEFQLSRGCEIQLRNPLQTWTTARLVLTCFFTVWTYNRGDFAKVKKRRKYNFRKFRSNAVQRS